MIRRILAVSGIMGISRLIGILREFMISAAFGISKLTDTFYQASWPITAVTTVTNGPFLTSLSTSIASHSSSEKKKAVQYYGLASAKLSISILCITVPASIILYLFKNYEIATLSFLIGLSASASVITGYYYAATVSLGRLQFASVILLFSNVSFSVLVIVLYIIVNSLSYWHLPLMLTISCIITLIFCCMTQRDFFANTDGVTNTKPEPIQGFSKSFLLSSTETLAFLSSQALIVYLASISGEGWLSAILLTQKIIFSINGLILSPFASILMIRITQCDKVEALNIFKKGVTITLVGLFLIMSISLLFSLKFEHLADHYIAEYKYEEGMRLVIQVLPAISFWLIPTGMNIILCRIMFAKNLAQNYTSIAITSYAVSSAVRLIAFHAIDINYAIILGAAVELIFTIILFMSCYGKIKSNKEII